VAVFAMSIDLGLLPDGSNGETGHCAFVAQGPAEEGDVQGACSAHRQLAGRATARMRRIADGEGARRGCGQPLVTAPKFGG
jgi:hypothetical protein